jgi:hypothetical protein
MTALKENLERLEEKIAAACRKRGARAREVELMAVSKTFPGGRALPRPPRWASRSSAKTACRSLPAKAAALAPAPARRAPGSRASDRPSAIEQGAARRGTL